MPHVNTRICKHIQKFAFSCGNQDAEDIYYVDSFPGDDCYESTKSSPAGNESDVLIKSFICISHTAAGYGNHRCKFAVTKGYGDHHDQCDKITD